MTVILSLATFCQPNSSFAFDFLQHNVHIRQEELWQTEGSCSGVSFINTGVAN